MSIGAIDFEVAIGYNGVVLEHRYTESIPASLRIEAVAKAASAPW
jgi:hypothetical protein